jgi:hypothetical protein
MESPDTAIPEGDANCDLVRLPFSSPKPAPVTVET